MTQKFHINSKGEPKPCKVTKRACRFGEHFESMADAQKFVESQEDHTFPSLKKTSSDSVRKTLPDGTVEYHNASGERHREDGPAIERADGSKEWWVHGTKIREEDN